MSHLTRGAWIEISLVSYICLLSTGRTSHEVRGLKFISFYDVMNVRSRTSHEVRGLKSLKGVFGHSTCCRTSHEVRGLK